MTSKALPVNSRNVRSDILLGVRYGLFMAGFFSVIALAILVLRGPNPWREFATHFLPVVAAYVFGGVTSGAVAGLLRPLTRRMVGAMLVGVPASAGVFFAVFVLGFGVPWHWQKALWLTLALTCVFLGPVFAWAVWTADRRTT